MRLRLIFGPVAFLGAVTCSLPSKPDASVRTTDVQQEAKVTSARKPAGSVPAIVAKNKPPAEKSRFFQIFEKPYAVRGHADYCKRNPGDCSAAPGGNVYLPVTPKLIELLNKINRDVNALIKPASDNDQYGDEYWTVPEPRKDGTIGGDCDDYTMTKRKRLEVFLPKESMSAAFLDIYKKGVYDGSHAVLVVHTLEGDYILDNLSKDLKFPGDNPTYVFRGITDPNNQEKWWKVAVPDASTPVRNNHYFASAVKYGTFTRNLSPSFGNTLDDFKIALLAEPKPGLLMQGTKGWNARTQYAYSSMTASYLRAPVAHP